MSLRRLWPVLIIALAASCATTGYYARWPYRGPMFLITNRSSGDLTVSARDGLGRELIAATIKPNSQQCFRWPFLHAIGYLIAAGSDTLTTHPFEPWSSDGWEWSGQIEPVSNPRVCRP
jgi:hypothetical protein